jgi:hypothetical protein
MSAPASSRRPSSASRRLFSALIFIVALGGLASANTPMLPPTGAAPHAKSTAIMTSAHALDIPQSSQSISPVYRNDAPIHSDCAQCPAGCALGSTCPTGLSIRSGASTTNPTLFVTLATIPLDVGVIACALARARPPSLTELSISRI